MEISCALGELVESCLGGDVDAIKQEVGRSSELAEVAREWTKPEQPPAQNQAGKRTDGQARFDRD